jgi:7-keto-8-aminopelargonate synthetase-like enzyme
MASLEKCLQESQDSKTRMIVTDGVFSMDGHIAPLREVSIVCSVCEVVFDLSRYVCTLPTTHTTHYPPPTTHHPLPTTHYPPPTQICDLADKYNALVMIDECHATGFFGETGRGTDEYCGVQVRERMCVYVCVCMCVCV